MKAGDKVVCIKRSKFVHMDGSQTDGINEPKYNDICTVTYVGEFFNEPYLEFKEFNGCYCFINFRKIEPFRNKLTQDLAVQVLTEQLKPEIEHIQIKENA
jgi:hypothetical protein